MPPNPTNEPVTSQPRIKAIEGAFLAAAEGGEPRTFEAIRLYFGFIDDRLRMVERVRREAEPKHLDALTAFAQRAYRRPLTQAERDDIRGYYAQARKDGLEHDAAIRESLVTDPDVAGLPLPARPAEHRQGRRAAVRLRAGQPPQLLPLVEPAGRRAAGARGGGRPAQAGRDRRAGAADGQGSAGAGRSPSSSAATGSTSAASRTSPRSIASASRSSPASCAAPCSRSRCGCSST